MGVAWRPCGRLHAYKVHEGGPKELPYGSLYHGLHEFPTLWEEELRPISYIYIYIYKYAGMYTHEHKHENKKPT